MITIYVDMDSVLVDFKGRYVSLFGSDYPSTPETHKKQFNQFVSGGNFSTLGLMPNAKNLIILLGELHQRGINIEILSSLGKADNLEKVYKDKCTWLNNHGIMYPRNFVTTKKYKRDFANCHSILIDDNSTNIQQFISSGGIGILYVDSNWDEMKSTIQWEVNKLMFSGEVYPELPKKKLVFSREDRKTKYV